MVDTWTAASASVGEAYAAVASGGSAAWPDTAKRKEDKGIYSSLRNLRYVDLEKLYNGF